MAVLALVAAACGDSGADSPAAETDAPQTTLADSVGDDGDESSATTSTAGATDATVPGDSDGTTTTAEPAPEPEGDPAPDFTLALGDGGSFSLSGEAKPVYLVFWAEW